MKRLLLVRHAKSDWGDPGLPDHDRPLNERGMRAAPLMGRRLRERDIVPEVILTSTATRARATAELLARALEVEHARIDAYGSMYASSPDRLLRRIHSLDDDLDTVMLVGHNPEMSELVSELSGEPVLLPTCAVAELDFETASWAEVGSIGPERVAIDEPKHG